MSEQKNKRGRPATGRKRDVKFSFFVTEEEREVIKTKAKNKNMTIADYIMQLVNK